VSPRPQALLSDVSSPLAESRAGGKGVTTAHDPARGVFFGTALGRVESVGRETSSENFQPARLGDSTRCGSLTIWSRTRAVSPREPARIGSLGSFGERGPLLSGTWSDAFLYLLRLRTQGRWPGEGAARTDRETAEDPSPQAIPSPHGSAGWVRLVARRDAARRSASSPRNPAKAKRLTFCERAEENVGRIPYGSLHWCKNGSAGNPISKSA
jgi:hypothetical protein